METARDRIVERLGASHLGECLCELSGIYNQIEEESSEFCDRNCIHCTPGCGSCCEVFTPDITPVEAKMVAAYLLLEKKDIALIDKVQQPNPDHCPLYDENNPFHCQVYPARPLICRLFGQCASRMKDGSAAFHRCKFEGGKLMPEKLVFSADSGVKTMDEYGIQIHSLDSGEGDDVEDLNLAVSKALNEVAMTASYLGILGSSSDNDDDDSTPTPNPQAS